MSGKYKFIIPTILILIFNGCIYKEIHYISKTSQEIETEKGSKSAFDCVSQLQNILELRKWIFINENKLYVCGGVGTNNYFTCGCKKEDINYPINFEEFSKNWFNNISYKELVRKWKNKPMPKYLQKAYMNNLYIIR